MAAETKKDLLERCRDLQERLDEAEETLRALRSGEVDAVVASGPDGDRVYTLKGADEAYRVMVQNMADGALAVSRDGLILFSNEQFATLLGIALERVIGSSIHDFIAAEDACMLSALLSSAAETKTELRFKKGPAALVPVQLSTNKLSFEGTECICLIVTDLTEQKRNREIVAAERLARSILDQSAGALLVLDPRGKIIRASRSAELLAGRTVLLRQFDDVFCLRDNSAGKDYTLDEILLTLQRHGSMEGIAATALGPDGQAREVMLSASPLVGADSERLGTIVLLSDVSGIRRAEAALRESESRLRTLGDNLPDGAIYRYCQDINGHPHFEFISAGIESLNGVPAPEIMRDAAALEETLVPEDRERLKAAVDLSREQLTRFEMEVRYKDRATGELRWSLLRSIPSRRGDGSTVWDGIQLDITDRRHAEEVVRQKQKLESIGVLAGGIAHDFNNLLTVIIGSASMAREECFSCEHADAILSASQRAASLTRQLMAYAGKGRAVVKVINLAELISQSTQLLRASVPARVSLDFDFGQDLPCLEGDPSQVEQILMNLVINAGEAILPKSDGLIKIATSGCEVTADKARREPSTQSVEAGRYVCLTVQDNGAGMDEHTVSRIFDPFFTTKFTGRGLGLAAVHGIVRSSRGFIKVRSQPSAGTTFQVFLPAFEKMHLTEQLRMRSEVRSQPHGSATILIVDDEEMVRKLARMTLKRYGYVVLEAQNGAEALQVLAAAPSRPDVMLLDLTMPVMGGDELLPILSATFPSLRIVVSSGYPEEETRKTLPSTSPISFLQKPYTGVALVEKIQKVLEERR